MAKLSVVVPSNEVEVGGVKYRKVERKAQAGDIVKITDEDAPSYLPRDAFFAVKRVDSWGDVFVNDEDGDDFDLGDSGIDFEVYEKVTEPTAVEYREVNRKAEKGERILIVNACDYRYSNGDVFVVEESKPSDVMVYVKHPEGTRNGCAGVLKSEYVVLEPVNVAEPAPQPERLKVGEYAKVIQNGHGNYGKIVKVTRNDYQSSLGYIYSTDNLDGVSADIHKLDQLVRATESEVEAAKKALERVKKIGEFADGGYAVVKSDADGYLSGGYRGAYVKVRPTLTEGPYALEISLSEQRGYSAYCNADALRKVTREEYEEATKPKPMFNAGDKVRLISGAGTGYLHGFKNGDVCEVTPTPFGDSDVRIKRLDNGGTGYAKPDQLEKVSEEEAKWAAIGRKVNEFKRGDIVKCTGTAAQQAGLGEVVDILRSNSRVRVNYFGRFGTCTESFDIIALVTPVEQRFDRSEGGASRKEGEVLSK